MIKTSSSLTRPQREIMAMLDGRWSPLPLPATYKRACVSLKKKGMLDFSEAKRFGRLVIYPRLTDQGARFIYHGGIDR